MSEQRRYRKKPVEVEAVQNLGDWKPILAWLDHLAGGVLRVPFGARPAVTRNDDGSLNVETLEGTMRAEVGDWLICGVKGELYPCKPDIFEATYEPADSNPQPQITEEDRERLRHIADELDPPVRMPGPVPFQSEVRAAAFLRNLANQPGSGVGR